MERQGTGQWLRATHFPTPASMEVRLFLALARKWIIIESIFERRSKQVGLHANACVLLRKVLWDLC